jgi:glycosyltransferase involved in cell wall biosynthesis
LLPALGSLAGDPRMNDMRIAFNATALLSPLTGIGQYCQRLAGGLLGHADIDAEFFYGAIWSNELRAAPPAAVSSALPWLRKHIPGSYSLRRIVQNQRFSAHAKPARFDLYHEPNILPLPFDGPTVVTVHDLSWIRYPEAHPVERVRAMNKHFEPGLRRASLVLTDSEFVKQELMDVFRVSPERIQPILLGVEDQFRPRSARETQNGLQRYQLEHGQYVLAVGTLGPRKNLALALRAFMQLPSNVRTRHPLVLVGMKGWHTSDLERQIEPLVQAGQVRQLGYLPREDLATVTAGAATLIYPSVYEGFGLPPLEAMACGVPVIASNVSSIPEVVGDSGVLIDPQDVDGLAKAIEALLASPEGRAAWAEKALARSRQFSWNKCVEETVGAYRRVLSKS